MTDLVQDAKHEAKCGSFVRAGIKFYFSSDNFDYIAVPESEESLIERIDAIIKGGLSAPHLEDSIDASLLDLLKKKKILNLAKKEGDETETAEHSCTCSNISGGRIGLQLLLNQYCNLRCVYCLDGARTYESASFPKASKRLIERTIDVFWARLSPFGQLSINLFGGEPLLTWEECKHAIGYARSLEGNDSKGRRVVFSIQTNLTILPSDFGEVCRTEKIDVYVNIDGPADVHDISRPSKGKSNVSYAKTVRNLKQIKEHGVDFYLRATVTSLNHDRLSEVVDLHERLGARESILSLLRPTNSDSSIFEDGLFPDPDVLMLSYEKLLCSKSKVADRLIYKAQKRIERAKYGITAFCGATETTIATIDVKGDVYTCAWFVGSPHLKVGSVWSDEVIEGRTLNVVRQSQSPSLSNACSRCEYRKGCGGGCSVTRVLTSDLSGDQTASIRARLFQCAESKSTIHEIIFRDFERRMQGASRNNSEY